ncbi:MAG TPA: hypothetical protein VHK64_08510 [Nocardioidaceae bacterium]|nr:hypothetical protein [Nocardioidaceae bacterium]
MSDWALTKGLQNLRNQVNAAFPDRDKASDGTIGDAAHQAETSSHNPDDTPGSTPEWNGDPDNDPEVRAWDMDSDLSMHGVDAQDVVDHIRHLPGVSNVLRYIIYNRKIYKASNGWTAQDYTGASAHTEHIHFTGAFTQSADNNTSFDFHLEDLVALDQSDIDKIVAAIGNIGVPVGGETWAAKTAWGYSARKAYEIQNNLPGQLSNVTSGTVTSLVAAIPTADQNAQAVLDALGGESVPDIVAALKAALGSKAAAVGAGLQA